MQDNIIFYFIIYSFLGWCLESIYKTIIFKRPTNSGFLYGPFCPMYGIGAVLMIELSKLSNNIFVIFLISFVFFTIWEYVVAVVLEGIFKTKYWDYSDLKFNFQGRVCLKNSLYWGILGVLLIFVIHPAIEEATNIISDDVLFYVQIILCLVIVIDSIVTICRIMIIDKKIRQVFEIGEVIKEKIMELKKHAEEENYKENIQKIVSELRVKQDKLKVKVYKRIVRLKKSFPNMHSENIAKFTMQKIELKDLKNKIKNYKRK